jgi:hypothetical protein
VELATSAEVPLHLPLYCDGTLVEAGRGSGRSVEAGHLVFVDSGSLVEPGDLVVLGSQWKLSGSWDSNLLGSRNRVELGTLSLRQWQLSGSWQDAGNQIRIGRFSLNFWRELTHNQRRILLK